MGVPAELLGKQVRCPNCKQVVLAPVNTGPSGVIPALSPPPPPQPAPQAPVPAAPPIQTEAELPTFAPPRREAADSVFSDPEESEDEVFSQPGGRVPSVPPLDLTAPHASANPRPPARGDNPFEMSAPTAASQSLPQRPDRPAPPAPAPTSELPNPFLELEPVTLPAVFANNPSGSKPAAPAAQPSAATQPFPAPFPVPAPAPRPAYPTPGAFPAPFPAPAPVPASSNPFDGIDATGPRPVVSAAPTAGPEVATEELDDQPRRRRRKRGEEEPPKPEEKPQRSTRTRLAAAPAAGAAGGGSNLVLYIVIGYAVLATLLAIYGLFIRSCERLDPGHPLSTVPDLFGEFSPSKRKEVALYKFAVDGELPEQQKTKVKDGNKIAVGQLEIEAVKVEMRKLNIETKFKTGNTEPNTTSNPALVLTLNIKNASGKPIYPMDPAFTRKANPGSKDNPITRLVVNKKDNGFFAGGAIDWPLPTNGQVMKKYEKEQERDWEALKPGESRPYVVFTDTRLDILKAVRLAKEPLLWRVEVRRAPVELRGKEVPVTAVIGVEFKQSDILGWES